MKKTILTTSLLLSTTLLFAQALVSSITDPNIGGHIKLLNPTKTSNGTASDWTIFNMTGVYGNSLQFWSYDNLGCAGGGMCTNRFTIMDNGNVGVGAGLPVYKFNVQQDISMNRDIDVAQFGITGATDTRKRLSLGYDVNGAGFGFIKAGWYGQQWTNLSLQPDGGNVGVGTSKPNFKLNVEQDLSMNKDVDAAQFGISSSSDNRKRLAIGYDVNGAGFGFIKAGWYGQQWTNLALQPNGGNVGVGTTTPNYKFNIEQDISMNKDIDVAQFGISSSSDNRKRLVIGYDVNGAGFGFIKAGWYGQQWTNLSLQPNGGNVGIGITNPTEKLAVNGNVRAKEVKVETANWPDYVFEDNYKVGSLQELETYIKTNKHLPEMPSAKEAETNGIELGEMNKKLLQKVEELTLYMIEMKKENEQLKKRVEAVERAKK